MTSLRSTILTHALPLLPQHSFTRQTLSLALSSLPSSHPDHRPTPTGDTVLDTIFGGGPTAPAQALAGAWAEEGLGLMSRMSSDSVRGRLKDRLRYSAVVGEHLVEAYALMASPSSNPSVPIPKIPESILSYITSARLPPLYTPPGTPSSSSSPGTPSSSSSPGTPSSSTPYTPTPIPQSSSNPLSNFLSATGHRLPFLAINPLGPLSYAFQIAHSALTPDESERGTVKGLAGEPTGSGPEWYTSRVSLMIAYLAAESQLLQPYPEVSSTFPAGSPNPHLASAENKLDEHLDRYDSVAKVVESGEQGLGQLGVFIDYVGKSAIGLIRSRGF